MDVVTYAILENLVDEKIGEVESGFTVKPSVATAADLPESGNEAGDLRLVREDGSTWVWDGSQWVQRAESPIPESYIRGLFN